MARVAIHAVVDISADTRVREPGRIVSSVATGAGKDGIVRRIRVAISAHAVRIAVIEREKRVIRRRQ